MNDERFLKDWLRETTSDAADPQASADRVLARVPEIRQRSRWYPWLPGRRRREDDTPTGPQGRTRLMFSPVKAITAGALVLALSAAFLIGQPLDRSGDGVPGAEQEAAHAPPVEVNSRYLGISCDEDFWQDEGDFAADGPVERSEGAICEVFLEWSDPRLQGTDTYASNGLEYLRRR